MLSSPAPVLNRSFDVASGWAFEDFDFGVWRVSDILIGDGASTERLKTGAVHLEESGSSWARRVLRPTESGASFRSIAHSLSAIGYWLLAIGYCQRASGELPLRTE
jgi:hypothetical protein